MRGVELQGMSVTLVGLDTDGLGSLATRKTPVNPRGPAAASRPGVSESLHLLMPFRDRGSHSTSAGHTRCEIP
jgi:hypothetical protein